MGVSKLSLQGRTEFKELEICTNTLSSAGWEWFDMMIAHDITISYGLPAVKMSLFLFKPTRPTRNL